MVGMMLSFWGMYSHTSRINRKNNQHKYDNR
jgi:hypothetical protein